MERPLISVVMPAYNAGRFIQHSIESVLNQTYSNWELIIIDDGSIDDTRDKIEKFLKTDSRVSYYYQENGKAGKARNLGVKHSKGGLIAFLDSDDLWLPDKLHICVEDFLTNEQDLLYTNSYVFEKEDSLDRISELPHMHVASASFSGESGLRTFLYKNLIPTLTVLVTKEAFETVKGFPEGIKIAEDYRLWLKMLAEGYVLRGISTPLSLYRVHDQSTTGNDKISLFETIHMLKGFMQEYPSFKKKYKPQIINWFARYVNEASDKKSIGRVVNKVYLQEFELKYNLQLFLYRIKFLFSLQVYKKVFFHTLVWQNLSR